MRATRWVTALVSVTGLLTGCQHGGGAVALKVPSPTGAAADECAALSRALDHGIAGLSRRATSPTSPFTAAWGDPAVTLRCGVAPRAADSKTNEAEIASVQWRIRQAGDQVLWETFERSTGIEVRIPRAYNDQENVIADLGAAIADTVPATPSTRTPEPSHSP
jgi:hypothetical protein